MLEKSTYETYIRILEEELVPALGCTEPIAIALASAKAREALILVCSSRISARAVWPPPSIQMTM